MALKQKDFTLEAGDRAVLWVDPAQVDGHAGTKWPVGKHKLRHWGRVLPKPVIRALRPWAKRNEPFLIPRQHFGPIEPVVETERYLKVEDFIAHKQNVTASAWYAELMADLARDGVARHKEIALRTEQDVLDFLHGYVGRLVTSLATEGFQPEHGGYESTAMIDADGRLCKAGSGNHRFKFAKALGVAPFPLRVVAAHEDWAPEVRRTDDVLALLPRVEAAHR